MQSLSEVVHASINAVPAFRGRFEQLMHQAATSPLVNPNVVQGTRPAQSPGFSVFDVSFGSNVLDAVFSDRSSLHTLRLIFPFISVHLSCDKYKT